MKSLKHDGQTLVNSFFDKNADYWRDTYKGLDIQGTIYQRRQETALCYVKSLSLPRAARVLEIGCGAGLMTRKLAEEGFKVEAIDPSQVMIDLTKRLAYDSNLSGNIFAHTGDAHNLPYENESFDLIVALGVVPWLVNLNKALNEITRVLKSDGFIVLTMDNANRLTTLIDPKTFPPIEMVIRNIRRIFPRNGLTIYDNNYPAYSRHTPRGFNALLQSIGLKIIENASVGFGPFTFLGNNILPEELGAKINCKLQQYADNKRPIVRSSGSQYIVLATKRRMSSK